MNSKEITLSKMQLLREAIDKENKSPFSTDDLVKIVEADQSGTWSEPMTSEQLLNNLNSWTSTNNG
jgi:hypothetical protein